MNARVRSIFRSYCRLISDIKMNCFRRIKPLIPHIANWKQNSTNVQRCKSISKNMFKPFCTSEWFRNQENVSKPLRSIKPKSQKNTENHFLDMKQVRTVGGNGGDGAISFAHLWGNDCAGPDGGDGGHGGHVIFQAQENIKDLSHIETVLMAEHGENGHNKDCFGKIVGDLSTNGAMFIAARGGTGGHGNAYFKSNLQQSPCISEYGAQGENLQYVIELRSMAHIGLIGLPNAGKSTLLRAITRARPKVAAYPFTTLRPYVGMILYDDYEQIAVADLPGLISDSHKNRGLGIQFLKHVERCKTLLFILDVSSNEPWTDFNTLKHEITQFNIKLNERSVLIAANKMDLPEAKENLEILTKKINLPIIPISAKIGTNVSTLLKEIRILYDAQKEEDEKGNILEGCHN
ncbi:mitochondrial ribosome-associated GTPase 2 isoform X4 [Halictus rubicundus]|uniref:mitochondrial ribosome-associated GTPase 2 isoform X4 n=1 Tax=Halictus rubicundus TaxID=77578 RepID=UPI0040370DEC